MLPETITAHSDPYFVNRVTEFSRFRQLLNSSSNLATIILHGPAGIGKTSLLKEFGALCMQEKITYVYVDLDHYEFDRSPNYLAIVFNLWYQLGIDEIQSLHDLIFQGIVPTFLGASSPKSNSSGNTSLNMGDIVDVEGKNQFAFGNNNTLIEKLLIQIGTNEEIQVLIRTQLTQAFQKHLQKLIENQPIIFLLDSWDKMVTEQGKPKEIGEWLQKELLDWSRFHNLKNLKSVISCKQERGLDDIRKQAHIVPLDPLSAPDVQRYFTARLGNQYTNQEVQSLTNLAQGIPSVMSFMAIGIEQHGNSEILNRSNKFRSDNLSETVRFAIEGFLQRLPCNFMGLPKIAAIPRRFNREQSTGLQLFRSAGNTNVTRESYWI